MNAMSENEDYLSRQLISYIGNKRALLDFIGTGIAAVQERLGKPRLDIFDVFSGSGVVSRYFKRFARRLVVNDIEKYAHVISACYLANRSEIDIELLRGLHASVVDILSTRPLREGFIRELYAPLDDELIASGERAFYTVRNAMFLDTARALIDGVPSEFQAFFLAPLLSEASIHANTSGVFKGFYKNRDSGIGQFGGKNRDALFRIKGDIQLPFPRFSNFDCETEIFREDAGMLADRVDDVDLAYLDPPYNQHPYGSNYFMLNLLVDYRRPERISAVSGIPVDWTRSDYNKAQKAFAAFEILARALKAKFLLVSFNSEGFISPQQMCSLLGRIGKLDVLETKYNTFRGSRNLGKRALHVREYLYLVEKT